MKTNEEDLKTKLSNPLPAEAITKHPTKTYLSSIKAVYVTERFNDVFGVGKWSTKLEAISADLDTGMVVVKVIFEVPELGIYYESYGGNDNGGTGNKNFDLGDAYKGASTDAITKIGSYLGVGIDVFKGKHDSKPAPKQKDNEPDKWLNKFEKDKTTLTKDWTRSLATLREGKDVAYLRKYFKISKQSEADLLNEYQN